MFEINIFVYILCNTILKMLIKLVVKIYSLKLVSVYQGYTLIVFMTQGYLTAERLRTTDVSKGLFVSFYFYIILPKKTLEYTKKKKNRL